MDGTTEGKVFAPGYGEFSTGGPGGDLEAVSLASPTDSRQGPAPAEFGALSGTVAGVFDAVATANRDRAEQASDGARTGVGRRAHQGNSAADGVPDESRYRRAQNAPWARVIGVPPSRPRCASSQNELDLRLLYQPVIDVDLARLALWARQLPIDVEAEDRRFGAGRCRRTGSGLGTHPTLVCRTPRGGRGDAASSEAADAEDLPAVGGAAAALNQAVAGLHVR